jgi:hypothetical protein
MPNKPPQPTRSKPVIATSLLAVGSGLYLALDAVSNADFVLQQIGFREDVARFLGSPRGIQFVFVSSVLALIVTFLYQQRKYENYYRELEEAKTQKTISLSKMSNQELKEEVLKFTRELHEFNRRIQMDAPPNDFYELSAKLKEVKSEQEQQEIVQQHATAQQQLSNEWWQKRQVEYEMNYRAKMELLCDEMYRRIPLERLEGNKPHFWQNLAGARPIAQIAVDLEKIANMMD